ncbi:MAG TPA: hypothetical protein VNX46_12700, partial [Candidatus Acidoferrum sp.]|nr:hypothetical protein [Candidatus Acidoferrum sp.]
GMNLSAGFLARLGKRFQEKEPVLVAAEDWLAPIASIEHMIDRSRILDPEFSGHKPPHFAASPAPVNWQICDYAGQTPLRATVEQSLASARQVCRETGRILAHQSASATSGQTPTWLEITANHSTFWAEAPEEALRGYQELIQGT